MEGDRNRLRQEIEATRASMAAKLGEISGRVDDARSRLEQTRNRLSMRHNVEQRPWLMLGLSVMVGFVLYRLLHARRPERLTGQVLNGVREGGKGMGRPFGKAPTGASRFAADRARASARKLQHRAYDSGVSFARFAFDSLTRTVLTSVGGALAAVLVDRIKRSMSKEHSHGELSAPIRYGAADTRLPAAAGGAATLPDNPVPGHRTRAPDREVP